MAGQPITREAEGRPPAQGARGYTRPPFAMGHELSMRHGAYSPRRVEPLAQELVEWVEGVADVSADLDYLKRPEFGPAIWAWARSEARVQLLTEWLIDRGSLLTDKGKPLGALKLLQREEASAASRRRDLGLDPLSRARLGRDVAAGSLDAARLFAQWAEEEAAHSPDATLAD